MSANDEQSKLLATVRGLLAKAESTEFEAERDAFRAKADELMVRYAISKYDLDADAATKHAKFGAYTFDLTWYWDLRGPAGYELQAYAYQLMGTIINHCRLVRGPQKGDGLLLFGMKQDFEFFEMLFTSLLLEMTRMMSPRWQAHLTREENVVNFKHAGAKWQTIAEQLRDHEDYPIRYQINGQLHGCYIAMYKKGLKATGQEQIKVQPQVHARSFMIGFNQKIWQRLHHQREAIANEPGTGLVLVDMSKELMEYAKQHSPDFFAPPKQTGKKLARGRTRYVATSGHSMDQGRAAGARVDLGGSKLGQRGHLNG
jgi:hypothetical protein